MDRKDHFTGIIVNSGVEIVFYESNNTFTFMSLETYNPIGQNKLITLKPDEYGYIHGITHEGHSIAIYLKKEMEFLNVGSLHTWIFIVSDGNINIEEITKITGIRFLGGILNNLYDGCKLKLNYDDIDLLKQGKYVIDSDKSINEYSVIYNAEPIKILFSSSPYTRTTRNQFELTSGPTILDIVFQNDKSLDAIETFYGVVLEMCQFLAFRENVGFESIQLLVKQRDMDIPSPFAIATCFVEGENKVTEKESYNCINIEDIGDSIIKLIETIMKADEQEASYCVGFLPHDDDDVFLVNNTKIKELYTALECEAELTGIKDNNAKDRVWNLMNHYSIEFNSYLRTINAKKISYQDIEDFIKYRNKITHGKYMSSSISIAKTAFALFALVYISILRRIGVESENVIKLIDNEILR